MFQRISWANLICLAPLLRYMCFLMCGHSGTTDYWSKAVLCYLGHLPHLLNYSKSSAWNLFWQPCPKYTSIPYLLATLPLLYNLFIISLLQPMSTWQNGDERRSCWQRKRCPDWWRFVPSTGHRRSSRELESLGVCTWQFKQLCSLRPLQSSEPRYRRSKCGLSKVYLHKFVQYKLRHTLS